MRVSLAARLGLAIAALLTAGMVAGAQAPAGGPGFGEHRPPFEKAFGPRGNGGHWWNNPEMVEKLKLSDEQRKQMDEILLQHREKLIDLRGTVQKAELEMEPLMRDDQPNEARILAQIDKVAQARAELEKANARFLLALRGKLTPEQWKLLQAERNNRGQQRGGWGRDGQGPGGQGPGGELHQYHRTLPPPPPAPGAGPQGMAEDGLSMEQPAAPEPGDEL
jgi:Spy/CpxP family protein refolding chaperone